MIQDDADGACSLMIRVQTHVSSATLYSYMSLLHVHDLFPLNIHPSHTNLDSMKRKKKKKKSLFTMFLSFSSVCLVCKDKTLLIILFLFCVCISITNTKLWKQEYGFEYTGPNMIISKRESYKFFRQVYFVLIMYIKCLFKDDKSEMNNASFQHVFICI